MIEHCHRESSGPERKLPECISLNIVAPQILAGSMTVPASENLATWPRDLFILYLPCAGRSARQRDP